MGFKFKNIHSDSFTRSVKIKSKPLAADVRLNIFTVPHSDGSLNMSSENPYKRYFSEDIITEVQLSITASNRRILENNLGKLAGWLCGSGELIFDNTPLSVWDAYVVNEINVEKRANSSAAVITVNFRSKPFCRFAYPPEDTVKLGLSIYLGTSIPIGYDLQEENTFITQALVDRFTVINPGTAPVRPVITVKRTDGGDSEIIFYITVNSRTFYFDGGASEVIIDCSGMTVTDAAGTSLAAKARGAFPELLPGENIMDVSSSNDLTVTLFYTPMCVYNADPDTWFYKEDFV